MENRATHIFRRFVVAILLVGMSAHLMLPLFSDVQKTAFTQWLDHNVVASGDESEIELRTAIRNLPHHSDDFWMLVREASELISNHKDEFRIAPFAPEEQDDRVTSWLIDQWSLFKHHKTGSNAILPEILNPIQKWFSNTHQTVTTIFAGQTPGDYEQGSALFFAKEVILERALSPLADGISINAP